MLGGATMALQNSGDRVPLRMGLGVGILYGLGIGVYDMSITPKGRRFYISGTFNSGHNHTVLTLLDTIYGAAGGAIVGCAVSLIANNSILDGLQYGSGAGAWIGFGFGLIDAYVLAQGPNELRTSAMASNRKKANGIIQFDPSLSDNVSLGFLNPAVFSQKVIASHMIKRKYSIGMQIVNVEVSL
jgi:hypothetical protein